MVELPPLDLGPGFCSTPYIANKRNKVIRILRDTLERLTTSTCNAVLHLRGCEKHPILKRHSSIETPMMSLTGKFNVVLTRLSLLVNNL